MEGFVMKNQFDGNAQSSSTRARWWTNDVRVFGVAVLVSVLQFLSPVAQAQTTVNLAQTPLLALKTAPGLVMLTLSRDHRLFYAAYNDTSDLTGDGVVDVGFKPSITYYGNFVSNRCYDYITTGTNSPLFRPLALADANGCTAPAVGVGKSQLWHGNWLNWATTSRMDALRRVLYGGYRVVDNATTSSSPSFTSTVLQGAYIPNDNHVAGKEFRPGRDTYDISQYTMLSTPTAGKQHLFVVISPTANTGYPFLSTTVAPVLRYITNADQTTERIWYWASADVAQGIGTNPANFVKGGGRTSVTATDRQLKVEACVSISGTRETGCTGYPSSSPTVWKPTGILHDYAANDTLKFGLLTGSYTNNYSGGVVRRNIRSFKDEINSSTGQFSDTAGIARTIDRITIHGWSGSIYDCGYQTSRQRYQGECKSWGAPIAEMMYEGLRFFSGKTAATAAYASGVSGSTSADTVMGFAAPPTWQNPYQSTSQSTTYGNPICSRPVQMVIADPLTSFDSDQLPGAYFTPTTSSGTALGTNDLTGLNVTTQADAVWNSESLGTRNVFIGQSGAINDGNPTAKSANGFSKLRGHAPDATQSEGSFYSAGVALFGRKTGVSIGAPTGSPAVATVNSQPVDTIAIALGSLTPRIEFPNPNGGKVSIVPISKAVYTANKASNQYQATGAITGFYYANYTPTSVTAVVNFSDSDQGTDNETDAQVQYDISISGNTVTVKTKQLDPNPGGIQSDTGYVISGTTADGLYLETRNCKNSSCTGPEIYYLDTLAGQAPKSSASSLNGTALPTYGAQTSRSFTLSTTTSTSGSYIPKDTLWYAAKYGGAGVLDVNGDPTNYFNVTNAANLPAQMGKAFRAAAAIAAVASTSVVGVGQRSLGTAAIYQADYDSLTWSSRLYAFPVALSGVVSNTAIWEASSLISAPSARTKLFLGRGGNATPLALASGGYTALSSAGSPSEQADFGDAITYEYILGDKSKEERKGGTLRNRGTTAASEFGSVLGDIVNSDPQIIAKKDYGYTAGDASYASFLASITTESLAVGANDGFFHIFDADPTSAGGRELLGFMPQAARSNIKDLASTAYSHRYFVDGSIGLGHAKIAVPGDSTASWRSVAVVAGGAGAQTVFAINTTSQSYSANSILWEINGNTSLPSGATGTLGNIMGRPAIGKLKNGTWVAVFGNGYNSTVGTANLFVVNLTDGSILKVIPTNSAITANGLGSTEIVKTAGGNQDTIDYVYGADYKGNIWRFDLSSSSVSSWPATAALVYSTPTTPSPGRPITAEIKVGEATGSTSIAGGKMIYFGTGAYLNANDANITSPSQALYGIYDDLLWTLNTSPSVVESKLATFAIKMPSTASDTRTTYYPDPIDPTKPLSPFVPWYNQTGKKGWVLPFSGTSVVAGERVIAPPVRYTVTGKVDAFLFTSIVPGTDQCVAGVDAWITGIDAMTGNYSQVFDGLTSNSVKITGGSPRGVFVLQDGGDPALYISQTIFNGTGTSTSFSTSAGGQETVTINGVVGKTQVLGIKLTKLTVAAPGFRQVWRQLK